MVFVELHDGPLDAVVRQIGKLDRRYDIPYIAATAKLSNRSAYAEVVYIFSRTAARDRRVADKGSRSFLG